MTTPYQQEQDVASVIAKKLTHYYHFLLQVRSLGSSRENANQTKPNQPKKIPGHTAGDFFVRATHSFAWRYGTITNITTKLHPIKTHLIHNLIGALLGNFHAIAQGGNT